MLLLLDFADKDDATRIAEIHMTAFGSNAMLLAQFPTEESREGLLHSSVIKTKADIDDPNTTVLVIRDVDNVQSRTNSPSAQSSNTQSNDGARPEKTGLAIAFAKWTHPIPKDGEYTEPQWIWPPGTDLGLLEDWLTTIEKAQSRTVGDTPCYHLTFMGTLPAYEKQGAATMMLRWGMAQCQKDGTPAYLESTLEAASFYEKNGFKPTEKLSLEYDIPGSHKLEVYEEIAFVYRPS
ncbi:Uu.00g012250.m01.CDS01 [Anthostomella pinea]|uniref:Uu.00g012250.m01.CDS01 n=1 Tax=Anthostomella pinea TaxID=933095 RepID=A0AAI8VS54_9PEZI|nr:Uu.00g012250.m01.CDS01 [Anthostomella pinea]